MQKLKKVDPETLILNFSQSDNPELESEGSIRASDVDSNSDVNE